MRMTAEEIIKILTKLKWIVLGIAENETKSGKKDALEKAAAALQEAVCLITDGIRNDGENATDIIRVFDNDLLHRDRTI